MPPDLVASGAFTGPQEDSACCLLELAHGGAKPILLPDGESRAASEDGDELLLRGFCRRQGLPGISLGDGRGVVLPAS